MVSIDDEVHEHGVFCTCHVMCFDCFHALAMIDNRFLMQDIFGGNDTGLNRGVNDRDEVYNDPIAASSCNGGMEGEILLEVRLSFYD